MLCSFISLLLSLSLSFLGLQPVMILITSYSTADYVNEIDAQRLVGHVLYKDGKRTKLSYPLERFDSDVAGRSFHNGRFIQKMREKAASLHKYIPRLFILIFRLFQISTLNFVDFITI